MFPRASGRSRSFGRVGGTGGTPVLTEKGPAGRRSHPSNRLGRTSKLLALLLLLAPVRCQPVSTGLGPREANALPPADDGVPRVPATLTLPQLRAAVERSHQRLKSLLVEVRSTQFPPTSKVWVRSVSAAKGQSRSLLLEHVGAVGPRDNFSFYDGKCFNIYFPYDRIYEVSRRHAHAPYTDKIHAQTIFATLAWWPPDDPSPPPKHDGRHFFLKDLLTHEPCRVRPFQEVVDGRRCHVVEVPGLDTLWIDGEAGTLIRRERLAGSPPRPHVTCELQQYKEVAPGVLLPFRILRTLHFEGSRKALHEVLRYEVNTVRDDQFTFTPGPGTLVGDRDTDTSYQVPGGLDLLPVLRDRVRAMVGPQPEQPRSGVEASLRLLLFGACGLALYGGFRLISSLYHRRWRRGQLPVHP